MRHKDVHKDVQVYYSNAVQCARKTRLYTVKSQNQCKPCFTDGLHVMI